MTGRHPRHGLDELFQSPVRLSIVAMAAAEQAEFGFVRDSVLSKQITRLENAGYVRVQKGYVGKRPRTWLSLTRNGRTAFTAHCAALRAIADAAPPAEGAPADS